jgi:hypothetical protein
MKNLSPLSHSLLDITQDNYREIRFCPIQRVFNVLLRTRLSRGPLIFAPQLLPPFSRQITRTATYRNTEKERLRSKIIRRRESLTLYCIIQFMYRSVSLCT